MVPLHYGASLRKEVENVASRLSKAKAERDGSGAKELYRILERVDGYQRRIFQRWTEKQAATEKWRNSTLHTMVGLFDKLRTKRDIHLFYPSPVVSNVEDQKQSMQLQIQRRGSPCKLSQKQLVGPMLPVIRRPPGPEYIGRIRKTVQGPMEAVWNTDTSHPSFYIAKKKPISKLWAQRDEFPDVPRLIELDVSFVRSKALHSLKCRINDSRQ
ncbi:protein FAM186A [Lissotriton helveticus]